MDRHRLVGPTSIELFSTVAPFSCFDFVDQRFPSGNFAIRRLFSLARAGGGCTLIVETIEPDGIIADENDEIRTLHPGYEMTGLTRISFWTSAITDPGQLRSEDSEHCIGYAILKRDAIPVQYIDFGDDENPEAGVGQEFAPPGYWSVFEAVFTKYPHPNNCIPNIMTYKVSVGDAEFRVQGILYAQQNNINRQCAQVALRSLLTRVLQRDISYREINSLANRPPEQKGLNVSQIRAVLTGLGISFRDYDYELNPELRNRVRNHYQKCAYAGIESGMGALITFALAGPRVRQDQPLHIVPFYGHTFNKDTWIPEADIAYFQVGNDVGYIPSECWTSSFLGHDDNFGPNFCVPRLYLEPENVKYVVEILKSGYAVSGIDAEAKGLPFLYSLLDHVDVVASQDPWLKRLVVSVRESRIQRVVLRAVAIDKDAYVKHLATERDWENHSEHDAVIQALRDANIPDHLWIVEFSIPQLFPANQRKLGEIVLNGEVELSGDDGDFSPFVLARLPGSYYFIKSDESDDLHFERYASALVSHFPVIRL